MAEVLPAVDPTSIEALLGDDVIGIVRNATNSTGAKQAVESAGAVSSTLTDESGLGLPESFGSPHAVSSPPPADSVLDAPVDSAPSPLDGAAKQLDFDLGGNGKDGVPSSPATPVLPPAVAPVASKPMSAAAPAVSSSSTTLPPVSAAATMPLPATPYTPLPTSSFTPSYAQNVDGAVDYDAFIRDTLLWVNKVRSSVYLVGGLVAIYLTHLLLSCNITLVSGVCYVLLLQAGLNFTRGFLFPKLQERCTYADSALTAAACHNLTSGIKAGAVLHDKHLNGLDALKTLRIVAVIWLVSLTGRTLAATSLAAALWLVAFVVPKVYLTFKPKIDEVVGSTSQQIKSQFLKLDPKARAALVVVPIIVAGYVLSRVDMAVAVLCLALYGRSCMAPAQVERLNSVVAPAAQTVSKVGGTVSKIFQGAATKYELTPTPAKAKRA